MFQRCPILTGFIRNKNDVDEIYARFVAYKMNVPVCGAIILNEKLDKVCTSILLLVSLIYSLFLILLLLLLILL
jgi:hypothetical protein